VALDVDPCALWQQLLGRPALTWLPAPPACAPLQVLPNAFQGIDGGYEAEVLFSLPADSTAWEARLPAETQVGAWLAGCMHAARGAAWWVHPVRAPAAGRGQGQLFPVPACAARVALRTGAAMAGRASRSQRAASACRALCHDAAAA
jgi:hypothetical protein